MLKRRDNGGWRTSVCRLLLTLGLPTSAVHSLMDATSDAPDFIILGEFSEIEGPISRKVLPEGIDLTVLDGQPFDVEAFVLRIMSVELNTNNDDWTTTLELPEHGFYAFVQHISLLDLGARGYVRPIAIAFISKSQGKIFNNFHIFHGYMTTISNMLKTENHRLFSSDLQKRLADLRLTESTLLHAKSSKPHGISPTPSTLREHIDDLCILQNRLIQHEHVVIAEAKEPSDDQESAAGKELLSGIPLSVLTTLPEEKETSYTPKVLSSLHRVGSLYSKELRNLDVLCGSNWDVAINEMESMLAALNMPDIVIYLQEQDLSVVQNNLSLLQLGKNAILNFNLHFESPFNQTSWHEGFTLATEAPEIDPNEHASHLSHFVGPNQSTPKDISMPPSYVRSANPRLETVLSGPNTASGSLESPSPDLLKHGLPFPMETISPVASLPTSPEASVEVKAEVPKIKVSTPRPKSGPQRRTTSSDTLGTNPNKPPTKSPAPEPLDHKCFEGSPIQGLETFGQTLWSCSNAGAGVGLLDFLRIGHSWSVHLIFSLLKGRPVIIYAEKENEDMVRNIVQALSIFVAFQQNTGPRGGGDPGEEIVIPWCPLDRVISFAILGHMKLMGFSKERQISLCIQKYATILDIEGKTLRAPYYKGGQFIKQILEEKDWPSESTYVAHVHSLIYDMSMKACLFYHFCCVGISPEENSTDSGEKIGTNGGNGFPRIARSQSLTTLNDPRKLAVQRSSANTWSAISLGDAEKEKRRERQLFRDNQKEKHEQFFRNWDIHESDREIVEYLASVVTSQQVREANSRLSPSEQTLPSRTIHLDYSQIYLFDQKK